MTQSISQFIYKGSHSQCLLFTMNEGQYLKPHRATVDVLIIVGSGKIEIGEEKEKKQLSTGDYIIFKKDVQHSVLALEDAKFYLVKLSPQD